MTTAPLSVAFAGLGKAAVASSTWVRENPGARLALGWDPSTSPVPAEVPERADSFEALLDSGVDALVLSGPSSVRAAQAVTALERGLHVLCEKPITATLDEAIAIERASDRADSLVAAVMFNMRKHRVVETIDALLKDFGPVHHAILEYTQSRREVTWRHSKEQGGGVLKEQGTHVVDLMLHWLGAAASVSATNTTIIPGREVEDHSLANVTLASGATAALYLSYVHGGPELLHGRLVGIDSTIEFWLSPYDPTHNAVVVQTKTGRTEINLGSAEALI